MRQGIKSDLEEHFNTRGVGGNEFHTNRILDTLVETQKKVNAIANANVISNNSDISVNNKFFIINEEEQSLAASLSNDWEVEAERNRRKLCHSKCQVKTETYHEIS